MGQFSQVFSKLSIEKLKVLTSISDPGGNSSLQCSSKELSSIKTESSYLELSRGDDS